MFAFREAHRAKDARKQVDLRDETGTRVIAGRRATKGAVTESQLREQLTIDLNALLNTVNLGSAIDLSRHPHVERSIINYGLPEISNRTIDEERASDIVGEIHTALLAFEPRPIPKTIKVARDTSISSDSLSVRYMVTGEMSCDPASIPVEFVADIEVDSGKLKVGRR